MFGKRRYKVKIEKPSKIIMKKPVKVILPNGGVIDEKVLLNVYEPQDNKLFWEICLQDGNIIKTSGNVIVYYKRIEKEIGGEK
jgi:hypothetical protein